jgi:ABC-type transport system involved in cytochrome bd biosynthesis fused ATPase/permease subunit
MQRVQAAAKLAFAHDFIQNLPQGYLTRIGERGSLLSGGQKQRIAVARSMISEPKVLLLDEATSALDPHAEGIVQQALDSASANRTTVIIAHKLATMRNADKIVVMSEGKIAKQGQHEELVVRAASMPRLLKLKTSRRLMSKEWQLGRDKHVRRGFGGGKHSISAQAVDNRCAGAAAGGTKGPRRLQVIWRDGNHS